MGNFSSSSSPSKTKEQHDRDIRELQLEILEEQRQLQRQIFEEQKEALRRQPPPPSTTTKPPPSTTTSPFAISSQVLYVLELKENKWYVGVTQNLTRRLQEHSSPEGGSVWTQRYPLLKLKHQQPLTHPSQENAKVKELMLIYGIDAVRGGNYSSINLTSAQRLTLEAELRHDSNACLGCGEKGHYVKNCSTKAAKASAKPKEAKLMCERCGRNTHLKEKCYAKTTLSGKPL